MTPEEQEREYGAALWSRDPDKCCGLRKVEPLKTKLTELRAWITAIRRDQTSARASARKVEWDAKFQLLKINPIADWTSPMVWSYALKHNVPYNPLHDKNYPSIGCTHCTRAVRPGESAPRGTLVRVRQGRMRTARGSPSIHSSACRDQSKKLIWLRGKLETKVVNDQGHEGPRRRSVLSPMFSSVYLRVVIV